MFGLHFRVENRIWSISGKFEIFEILVKSSNRFDDVSVVGMRCDADVNIAGLRDLSVKSVSGFDDVSIAWLLSVDDVSIAGLSLLGENLLIDLVMSAACVVVVRLTQALLLERSVAFSVRSVLSKRYRFVFCVS
ncbi:hypothetical protein F511_40664 [Dorcoceras hygrometricum]|uniref:Uncharacterized protein n=1 Tax=Dorcoceras hygrometricum TaxID=472368 RepID=A0A2Z7CIY5_9LAMI|nr:hypothetical protein F511_40664 [Dorcoceras hygrometricum]